MERDHISDSDVILLFMYICIYYIHSELRIRDYLFRSGKGAGPL